MVGCLCQRKNPCYFCFSAEELVDATDASIGELTRIAAMSPCGRIPVPTELVKRAEYVEVWPEPDEPARVLALELHPLWREAA
jgi:hypothetical protein